MPRPQPAVRPAQAAHAAAERDGATDAAADGFRPDLEGLRGVAILLVLLFHARIPGMVGGFIGVDVFFVLSGFLITGLLVRERERVGRIDLAAFYARRARRILPAALVIVVAILGWAWIAVDPLDLPGVAADGLAAALSVGNIRFALDATDYFAADIAPSPYLHYWSLGVEEQFYVAWPALLIVGLRGRAPRRGALLVLLAVLVPSFIGAALLTEIEGPWAFYSSPTRAWQLALGGLVAVAWPRLSRLPDRAVAPLGWLGLLAIVGVVPFLDPTIPYPGVVALVPAAGAAAVVLAGTRPGSVGRLLGSRPLRFLGLISFSLYLVHWPVLVLPAAGRPIDDPLPLAARLGLAVIAIALGSTSHRFVEQPFHRGRFAKLGSRRTLALAGAAMATVVVATFGLRLEAGRQLDAAFGPSTGVVDPTLSPSPSQPAPTGSPAATALPSTTPDAGSPPPSPEPTSAATAPTGPQPLASNVRPPLRSARGDWEPLLRDGCTLDHLDVELVECIYGDPSGDLTIVLVGDSHAAHWFPALERIAIDNGWRLIPYTKLSCRFIDMRMFSLVMKREYRECYPWRDLVIERLNELRPDIVIISSAKDMKTLEPGDDDPARQGAAMPRLIDRITSPVAIIPDTPYSQYDVPACLSRHRDDVRDRETSRAKAFGADHLVLERAAAAASGATLVDMSDVVCPWDPCPVVLDGMIVYRDTQHLTATFSATLGDELLVRIPSLERRTAGSLDRGVAAARRVAGVALAPV